MGIQPWLNEEQTINHIKKSINDIRQGNNFLARLFSALLN
jgi:hypothetical protein